jgi:hypothetical protein
MAETSNVPAPARAADATVGEAVLNQVRGDSHTAALPVGVDVYDRIVFVHGAVPNLDRAGAPPSVVKAMRPVSARNSAVAPELASVGKRRRLNTDAYTTRRCWAAVRMIVRAHRAIREREPDSLMVRCSN